MARRLRRGVGHAVASGELSTVVVSTVVVAVFVGSLVVGAAAGTAADGPGSAALPVAQSTVDDGFGFGNDSYRVDPPETAEIDLTIPDGGVFSVVVEAPDDHFAVELTAGAPSGGGRPTVRLDTGNVTADDPREYLSIENATVLRMAVHEHDLDGDPLPGGEYQLRVVRGSDRAAATLGVAPRVTVEFESQLNRSDLERDPVRTVAGETGLDPGESVGIRVTATGPNAFRITSDAVVAADGSFETAVDLGPVPAGASFEVTVHHDGLARARHAVDLLGDLPEPVDGHQVSNGITFAYESDRLTLEAAANQSITGETDLAEGAVVAIVLRSPESHLHVVTTTVDRHGTFAVIADLDGLQPRTDVVVSAVGGGGARGAAPAALVAPGEDEGDQPGGTGEVLLDDPGGPDDSSDHSPSLVGGLLALALGAILSVVANALLLGIDRSALSPRRE